MDKSIDLNCDMGESFGRYTLGCDNEVIKYITSANVACGFHASDPLVMEETVRMARENSVGVGAHPGYLDLRGFGRRRLDCSFDEIRTDIIYQIGALEAIARSQGMSLQHIKPHGALYNAAAADYEIAKAVCRAVCDYGGDLILLALAGPGGDKVRKAAKACGVRVAQEAFADRNYMSNGMLTPRSSEQAVIQDPEEVAERCLRMAVEGVVKSIEGRDVELYPQTICVHGDTPTAVDLVKRVRGEMEKAGVSVKPLAQVMGG